jgi:WD40 repeat protein
VAVLFNPNPDANLVAASYHDGDLVIFNPWDQKKLAVVQAEAHTLAASPDGQTLVTGDGNGTLQLFDFETLQLIYRMTAYDHDIQAIAFTSNSLRYFDIRGDHCNIWEPSVLVRSNCDREDIDSQPHSEEVQPSAKILGATIWEDSHTITALVEHHQGECVFAGRENGSITVFNTKTGMATNKLPGHSKDVSILIMTWNAKESLLASTDISSRFVVRKLVSKGSGNWEADLPLLSGRASQAISQILMSPDGRRLLVSMYLTRHRTGVSNCTIRYHLQLSRPECMRQISRNRSALYRVRTTSLALGSGGSKHRITQVRGKIQGCWARDQGNHRVL